MSENYFQHADHFKRILNEQESLKKARLNDTIEKESVSADNVDKNEKSIIEKNSA